MHIRPIRTDADHKAALARIEALWGADPGTEAGDELDVLVDLVEAYEARHYPVIAELDPIDAIQAHMDLTGRTQADLTHLFGSSSRASEVLARKRVLTVRMIHRLATEWHMPADTLIRPYAKAA
ncbi:MAG TPA: transcriptional regulator [Amaricoccus sp.]|nr:transcriptional regulator [Amaricoccus sp.]